MKNKIMLVITMLSISSLLILKVNAQPVSDLDSWFENARGILLSNYNSQITAHAGIILGLVIALATVGTTLLKVVRSNKRLNRILGIFLLVGIVFLLTFETGRLFYWSGVSSVLTYTDAGSCLSGTNSIIVPSNATKYMSVVNTYATNIVRSDNSSFTNTVARLLFPDLGKGSVLVYLIISIPLVVLILEVYNFLKWRKGKEYLELD